METMQITVTRKTAVPALAAAAILATVGVGWAAIPGTDGTIKACYSTTGGLLGAAKGAARIVDSAEACRANEKALVFNQQGPKGDRGLAGATGAPGLAGKDGAPGAPGLNGKDGAAGLNGKDGAAGLNGKDGAAGLNGKDGATGPAGKDGKDGATGPAGPGGSALWAVVQADGQLTRGSHVVSVTRPSSPPGLFTVKFDRDVSTCAFIATLGAGFGEPFGARSGEVRTSLVDFPELDRTSVRVVTNDSTTASTFASSFHLVVFC
jgi:hypothetical protein